MTDDKGHSGELVRREPQAMLNPVTDSWIEVMKDTVNLARHIAGTEFVPRGLRGTPEKVTAAILHGRELGLPPMTSLAVTDVIEGRPSLSAEGARALVLAAGHEIEFGEMTGQRCIVRGRRAGREAWTTVDWSMADATRAGLTNKTNWKSHPRRMLQARATAELCRLIFPDVLHGLGFAEEAADGDHLVVDGQTGEVVQQQAEGPRRTVARKRATGRAVSSSEPPTPAVVDVPLPGTNEPPRAPQPAPVPPVPEPVDVEVIEAEPEGVGEPAPVSGPPVTAAQLRMLGATWGKLGVSDDDRRHFTAVLVGRELDGGSTKDLTKIEATRLIDRLTQIEGPDELDRLIADAVGGSDATGRGVTPNG